MSKHFWATITENSYLLEEKYLSYSKPILREKCPNTEFFWSVFSCIRTEYRNIRTRKPPSLGTFHAVQVIVKGTHYSAKSIKFD